MNLIICIDDSGGILFNRRRVSSDREVIKRIVEVTKNSSLNMSPYSAKLFESFTADFSVDDAFLLNITDGDFYFCECEIPSHIIDKAEKIIVYRWNRKYPSDVKFPIDKLLNFKLVSSVDFVGYSHDKITEEVYVR